MERKGEKQVINPFAEYQWISQPYPEYNMPKVAHDVKPHRSEEKDLRAEIDATKSDALPKISGGKRGF